jgi:hypothetical protein
MDGYLGQLKWLWSCDQLQMDRIHSLNALWNLKGQQSAEEYASWTFCLWGSCVDRPVHKQKLTQVIRRPKKNWRLKTVLQRVKQTHAYFCSKWQKTTLAWWPTSHKILSSGALKTWWRATVSSTTPRLDPRCPPVLETEKIVSDRNSSASWFNCCKASWELHNQHLPMYMKDRFDISFGIVLLLPELSITTTVNT